ncbi:MAG: formate dehydrogenase accessory protein FdhE [Thermincolia bacterium]
MEQRVDFPAEITELFQALDEVHRKYREELRPVSLSCRDKDTSLDQKAPLLNFVAFQLEVEKLKQAFNDVCGVLRRYRPEVGGSLTMLEDALSDERMLKFLVEKMVWQDKDSLAGFAKENELDEQLLSTVLFNVAKPFVTNYAGILQGQFRAELWRENFCPVCGWGAALAINSGEDNRRQLQCAMCDTEWSFKNLECPHCLNEDHETLQYLTVEDDEIYRVNVCDKCKGYIKSVNKGKLVKLESSFLTDVKTLHLDLLAQGEGYRKGAVDFDLKRDSN